jgi:hypothetical protein
VDVIHTDRQRSHGDRDVVTLEFGPRRFGRVGYQEFVGHLIWPHSPIVTVAAASEAGNKSGHLRNETVKADLRRAE